MIKRILPLTLIALFTLGMMKISDTRSPMTRLFQVSHIPGTAACSMGDYTWPIRPDERGLYICFTSDRPLLPDWMKP